MYRYRRRKLQRRRRASVATAAIAVLALAIGVPTLAAAQDSVLNGLGLGGSGDTSGGGTASPSPNSGAPPSYVPPLHGTNPHGQGTDAIIDLSPQATNPVGAFPDSAGEDIVAGDSRGEQNADGTYKGTVTLAYVLGFPVVQVTTNPGETRDGPLQGLQDGLDQLCSGSGNQLCLTLLAMHSATTSSGSTNSFTGADLSVGGQQGINATALTSNGDINTTSDGTRNCQVAHGNSHVAGAGLGAPAGETADVAQGDSNSTACSDGSQSVSQSSSVINLAGTGIPIPATGCDDGTPNTVFDSLSPLLATECNASDTNAGQTSSPYGVREALTAFVLLVGGNPTIKATTAGPESHAVAPGGPPMTPVSGAGPANNGGKKGNKGNKGAGGNEGGAGAGGAGAGAAAGAAGAGNGQLAFTGADLLALGLVGGALILGGLALTTTAGRRHRWTV
jgi:hypothetical protein